MVCDWKLERKVFIRLPIHFLNFKRKKSTKTMVTIKVWPSSIFALPQDVILREKAVAILHVVCDHGFPVEFVAIAIARLQPLLKFTPLVQQLLTVKVKGNK